MESPQKRKLEEELNPRISSPERSPKKKTAISYYCPDWDCKESFVQESEKESHIRHVHKNKYCFACDEYIFDMSIDQHIDYLGRARYHFGKKFRCSRCPKKKPFDKEHSLVIHVQLYHHGCAPCGKYFKNDDALYDHFYDVHPRCRGCGWRFRDFVALELHQSKPARGCRRPVPTRRPALRKSRQARRAQPAQPSKPAQPVTATAMVATTTEAFVSLERGRQQPATDPITKDLSKLVILTNSANLTGQTPQPTDDPPELQCRYCNDYRTRSEDELDQHCKAEHDWEYASWCGVCQEQFSNEYAYNAHFEGSPNHFICVLCEDKKEPNRPGQFKPWDRESQKELDEHRVEWHFHCVPCDEWFNEPKDLYQHQEEHHPRFICKRCDEVFLDKGPFRKHKRSNKHKERLECVGCTSEFDLYSSMFQHLESGKCDSNITERDLKLHINNIYRKKSQDQALHLNFQCPSLGCKKKFPLMFLLFRHLEDRKCSLRGWQHRTSLKKRLLEPLEELILAPLRCTKCDEYFGVDGRDEHIRDEHDSLFCFICNRHFHSRTDLAVHIRYSIQYPGGQGPEDRRCESCTGEPELYRGEGRFYDHMWTAHNSCAVCALNFDTKKDLIDHDKEVHFKCHVCSDISIDPLALKRHFREQHLKFSKIEVSTWRGPKPAVTDELIDSNSDAGYLTPDGSSEEMMMPVGRQPLITGFFQGI